VPLAERRRHVAAVSEHFAVLNEHVSQRKRPENRALIASMVMFDEAAALCGHAVERAAWQPADCRRIDAVGPRHVDQALAIGKPLQRFSVCMLLTVGPPKADQLLRYCGLFHRGGARSPFSN
jgi:hypothetical protein